MARLGAGAVRLLAALLVMGLAARGAAAIAIPSILATSDGGVITFISLANVSSVTGVDVLSGANLFFPSLLGSWADSKYAFTIGLVTGNRYRVFVTDLSSTPPKLLGNRLLPNVVFKPNSCPEPILGPLTAIKTGASYELQVATHCTVAAARSCAKATGQNSADVITLYTFQYKPSAGKLGPITAGVRAVVPVPQCQRATLLGTQLYNGRLYLLAATYTNFKNQSKRVGDLVVYELRTAFAKARGKVFKVAKLVATYRVASDGLNIGAAVPGSARSIFATVTNAKGVAQVYSWAAGRKPYIGGVKGTLTTKTYDDITPVGSNVYSALEDFTTVPAGDPPTGLLQYTTAAQLKAGQPGTNVTMDVVGYFEITYVGKA